MKPILIEIENYKSYRGKHRFEFSAGDPGLHFVTGQNLMRPELGANGIGKTGLFEALYWCYYGTSPRGLEGPSVVNWDAQMRCRVRVLHDDGSGVERSWKPNHLQLIDKYGEFTDVEQAAVDQLVGLPAKLFGYVVMTSQLSRGFFSLRPTEKLGVFSELLQLDQWLTWSKQAGESLEDVKERLTKAHAQVDALTPRCQDLEGELKSLRERRDGYEEERRVQVRQLKSTLSEVTSKADTASDRVTKLAKTEAELEESISSAVAGLKKGQAAVVEANDARTRAHTQMVRLQERESQARTDLEQLQSLKSSCPTCKQAVDKRHLKAHAEVLQNALADLGVQIGKAAKELRRCTQVWEGTETIVLGINEKLGMERRHLASVQAELAAAKRERQRLRESVSAGQSEVEKAQGGRNPYKPLIISKRDELERHQAELEKKRQSLRELSLSHEVFAYWKDAYKRIRLLLIDEGLRDLEIEANTALSDLGMPEWTISLDVERETKSGTISRGFQLLISAPGSKQPVPWESWSGGETQRLILAGTMGLIAVALGRMGKKFDFEVWDEPSIGFSKLDQLLEALQRRASDLNKQVWLIDHHALEFGGFKSVTQITMDEQGSHIASDVPVRAVKPVRRTLAAA